MDLNVLWKLAMAGGAILGLACSQAGPDDDESRIVAIERAALERWGQGDPSGFLEICDEDVVYFDPGLEHRIDGLQALSRYYETLRGQVRIDRFELVDPKVQLGGELAVLTFNYRSWSGAVQSRWNCTEVFRRRDNGWRLIQTHWSLTGPHAPNGA